MRLILNFWLTFFLACNPALAQMSIGNFDVFQSHYASKNLVKNPFCASNTNDITASGGTKARTSTGGLNGFTDCQWNPTTTAQTLTFNSKALPAGLKGQNCEMKVAWLGDASLVKAYVLIGGVKAISDIQLTNSGTLAGYKNQTFPCGDGTNPPQVVLESQGDAANVQYMAFVGEATNIGTVSTAALAGESYFAGTTSCSWARTSTTFGPFGTTAACPGPTIVRQVIGTWATTDSDLPRQTITNLPAGIYRATFNSITYCGANTQCGTTITDGTTVCEGQYASSVLTDDVTTVTQCTFVYNNPQASVSFELYGAAPTSSLTIQNAQASNPRLSTKFSLEYYPLTANPAVSIPTIDQTGAVIAVAGTCPAGTLEADGSAISRTTYNKLFTKIGITHGQGDGSTTFNIPDYRGRFLRGHANGSANDPDRASRTAMNTGGNTGDNVGSIQTSQYTSHTHTYDSITSSASNPGTSIATTDSAGATKFLLKTLNASNTGSSGGNETRPVNAYVKFCVVTDGTLSTPLLTQSVVARDNTTGVTTINTIVAPSATFTADDKAETYYINASGGALTANLPAAASVQGKKYLMVHQSADTNAITIDPNASELICGQSTIRLTGSQDMVEIQSNGANWIGLNGSCERKERIRLSNAVCSTTPCTIGDQSTGWVTSVSRSTTGRYSINFVSNIFSSGPTCTCGSPSAGTNVWCEPGLATTSLVAIDLLTAGSGSPNPVLADSNFEALCQGPR